MAHDSPVREQLPVMVGASETYRKAREQLLAAEQQMLAQIEAVAAMRRALPDGPEMGDYEFFEGADRVRLGQLFSNGKNELIVYHLMYWAEDDEFCPMCSMWLDGLTALAHHIEQRTNFVIASRAPLHKLTAWAQKRGWKNVRLLSDVDETFARDMGAEDTNGDPVESIAVFVKQGSSVRNTYLTHAYMNDVVRFMDQLCPTWHMFDLLPSGRGEDWYPSNSYE
jgi:predicted dithiol-disulfide oxidoreductase (DUF899 family)